MSEQLVSLQDQVAPDGICFGCGSKNHQGLHIKSHWDADEKHVVTRIQPRDEFTGWPGLVYGGYLAMLIDCHSNWTVMANHYRHEGRQPGSLPKIDCVTGNLNISYKRPTPMGVELSLRAWVEGEVSRKTRVICEVWAGDTLTVVADSIFVRVDTAMLKDKAHGALAQDG